MKNELLWIDSHAHLTMFPRDEILQVLERSASRGVGGVLVPATNGEDLDVAVGLAEDHPHWIVAAAGVHPHDADSLDSGLKHRIETSTARDAVVAVGEIGLDYHYMNSPREDQVRSLEWQLDLAIEADLPVILHNRDSWDDLESLLSPRQGKLRGVCHSFTEGPEQARRVMDLGLWIGISGMVTFKAADNIREMVAVLRPERVLVETDSPFLAPVPHRGKTNEPSFVPLVGVRLAEEWEKPVGEVAELSTSGFQGLFAVGTGWPAPIEEN